MIYKTITYILVYLIGILTGMYAYHKMEKDND